MLSLSLLQVLLPLVSLHLILVASQATTSTSSSVTVSDVAPTPSAISFGGSQSSNYTVIDIWVQPEPDRINGILCNVTRAPYKRTVAYTVTPNGYAVIDGDIIFGTEAELLDAAVHPSLKKRAISLTPTSSKKWLGGKVLYNYAPGLDPVIIDFFQEGVKVWTDRLPFLQFIYSNSPDARTVTKSNSFSSPVGCCGGVINLDLPGFNPSAAIHEIGHSE